MFGYIFKYLYVWLLLKFINIKNIGNIIIKCLRGYNYMSDVDDNYV